jgi:hypothetical protein
VNFLTIKYSSLIIFFLFLGQLAIAQRTETAINFDQNKNHIVIEVENDLLFKSDHYYTAGIALSYTYKNLKKTLAQLILKSKNPNNFTFSGFGIEQRMFTPFSIIAPDAIENDRPYSAYLMATNFSVLINPEKNLAISNEIGIGVIGPLAGGKELQTFVHEIIGSALPIGWEYQIKNAFLIDYQFRIEKGFFTPWVARHIIPFAMARVGTLKDQINIGLMIKLGNKNTILSTVKDISTKKDHFIWEWVFEGKLQGVFYDATLQGGLFNGDELVSLHLKDTFMRQYNFRMGVNLYYKGFFLRYMVQLNSPNFSVGILHRYGSINIGFSF